MKGSIAVYHEIIEMDNWVLGLKEDKVCIGHFVERSRARNKMEEEKVAAVEVGTGFNEVGLGVVPEKEVEN